MKRATKQGRQGNRSYTPFIRLLPRRLMGVTLAAGNPSCALFFGPPQNRVSVYGFVPHARATGQELENTI